MAAVGPPGPGASVAELIDRWLLPANRRAVPVTVGGRLTGMVTVLDIRDVPAEARATTAVGDVMGGREGVVSVSPATHLDEALAAMLAGGFEQLPVIEDERLVGMISMSDIARQVQLREALRID